MEIFGGFMVMMSILGFFLMVVWLVMPFVVFTIKGKLDRTLEVLERVEKRLAAMETRLDALQSPPQRELPPPLLQPDVPLTGDGDSRPGIVPGS